MERLLDYFKPRLYDLELTLFRSKQQLYGTVCISGEIVDPAEQSFIKFHAVGLEIESVKLQFGDILTVDDDNSEGRSFTLDLDESQLIDLNYVYDGQSIAIPIDTALRGKLLAQQKTDQDKYDDDHLIVDFIIRYTTALNNNMQGCYLSTYDFNGEEQRLVATQFESHYAREAFPCIDEPAAKAKFNLTLLVPDLTEKDVVLANTPLLAKDCNRFAFQTTPCMSTYLLAWVIGPLQSVSTVNKNGVKVSSYCALNQPTESLIFANDTAARALEYYDERFQEKYPLLKLDQVALPDFEAGAMENWGLVTYRESMMLSDKTATIETKQSIALTITHELSHQWFGNLVTMRWWDDLWLNESFASVIEYYATAALFPNFNIWQDFFTGYCFAALKRDCLPGVQSVKQAVHHPAEIATLFDSAIVYAKGAHLIFMLIRLMGETNFNQGLRDYFDKYKFNNTVGDNLWASLQPYADFDIEDFMHTWITQPGYPVLQKQSGIWQQKRFLITGDSDDTVWPLPEVSDDMSGHYLINLDDQDFQAKIANFDQLSQEQKLRLLIDRELLAATPDVASSSLFDLLPKFVHTHSSAIWNILTVIISDLKLFCPQGTPGEAQYKAYVCNLLQGQFKNIDFSELHDIDSTTTREILLGIAYYSEYEPILRRLADMYQDDLAKLDPELRASILTAKAYFAEDEVFDSWLRCYQTAIDPEIKDNILYALVQASEKPEHIDRLLALLEQPKIVRPQDHIFLFIYLMRKDCTRGRTLEWLITHWEYIEELTGEKSIEDYPRYAAGAIRTPEEAKKFYAFFDKMSDYPMLHRTLKIAHTDIDARLARIAKDSAGVHAKLKELLKGE